MIYPDVKPILYKFCKTEHADALLNHGTVFIGTFAYYTDLEKHGPDVGDAHENTKLVTDGFDAPTIIDSEADISPDLKKFFNVDDKTSFTISGLSLSAIHRGAPAYMYCVSDSPNANMGSSNPYDATVRINDSTGFFQAMFSRLRQFGLTDGFGVGKCVYTSRDRNWKQDDSIPIELLKGSEYAHQSEVRGIFRPVYKSSTPKLLNIPALRQFCERVEP